MVGIEGQYLFMFNAGPLKDFIKEPNLTNFKILEHVGNFLPMFQLVFQSTNDTYSRYLNEGSKIQVSFGKDKNNLTETTLIVKKLYTQKMGSQIVSYRVSGLFDAMPYLQNSKIKIHPKASSLTTIQNIAGAYFTVDAKDVVTSDSMPWVQNNITDRNMINNVWMHSYIPNSFMAIGITSDGTMRIRDIRKLASKPEDYKWKFTNRENQPKEIPFDNHVLKVNSGLDNVIFGYGRKKLVNDLEKGTIHIEEEDPMKPFLALASDLNRNKDIEKIIDEHTVMSSDNVHSNYHKSFLQNAINLTVFSSTKIKLTFKDKFRKINVLDLVYFKDEIPTSSNDESSEYTTGLWVVSKVGLVLENKKFVTFVDIVREIPNSIKGDLK